MNVDYALIVPQKIVRKMMSKELQEALDRAALAVQPVLDELLREIEEDV